MRAFACAGLLFVFALPAHGQRPVHRLDSLLVTVGSRFSADMPRATRSIEVIGADELVRQPGQTIQDVLARALGVDVSARSPAQADIAIRGGSVEQVLVLVDGMRVSDSQTGHFDLSLAVPLQEVERIEILRGPASAVYGADALGGVVNIVTRRYDAAGINSSVGGGSFETMSMAAGGHIAGSRVRLGGTGDYRRSDGHRAGTDYRIASGHVAVETLLRGRPLRATFGIADRDFGASKFYTSPESDFNEFERTRVITAHAAWEAPRAARYTIEPRVSLRRHDDDFVLRREDPDFYRNVHRTWQLGSELTARYSGDGVRAAVGGEAYRDIVESTNLGDRVETRGALFAEAGTGSLGVALGTAGVRIDWHSAYGSFVAPSLAGALWLTPAAHVRASVSRAFRAPTWTDRYYTDPANIGDPALQPEQAWEGEVGLELHGDGVYAVLSGYVRRTQSLIDWTRPKGSPPSTPWQIMNLTEATFRGLELALHDVDLLGARWTSRVSGISFDHVAADLESKYALRPLTRQASLELERTIAGVDLFLRGAYARRAEVRRAEEEGYTMFDARLSRTLRSVRVFLDVMNAGNTEYMDVSGVAAQGRSVYIGFDWNWRP